jgi:transposase-like protein
MAVERLKACDNIVELSQELGVHRRLLYKWRDQFDPFATNDDSPPGNSREATLRKEIKSLILKSRDFRIEMAQNQMILSRRNLRKVNSWNQLLAESGKMGFLGRLHRNL